MEKARQHSFVMFKVVKNRIAILGLALAVTCLPCASLSNTPLSILIDGAIWKAQAGEYDTDFDQKSVSLPITLFPPSSHQFSDTDQIVKQTLFAACNEVMKSAEKLATSSGLPVNLTFVHFTVFRGDQKLYPYPLGYRVSDGRCTGSISFVMPDLTVRYSKHSELDELIAILNSWGLGMPALAFETGTNGKIVKAEIEWLGEFGRGIETLFAAEQCIHALANLDEEIVFAGVTIRPKNYPRMEIEIVEASSVSNLSRKKVLGAVSFAIKDGRCAPLEAGD